ncbi:hypothetical protein N6H18_07125 [Reichenbachiella agarivorans]|uniref:Outer membrane protein beta-barrel domain-containing protein n=1 Tax=Reichenbachiella agarivorans TaxID=2979464 RepID=A0ABY6CTA3_9BACT|nr:hypothetical protein [Reichenbachiella agarivorans]UXP33723.1 hypothetical protein N6H18_07125 [Reichenbachiella agarivorans]
MKKLKVFIAISILVSITHYTFGQDLKLSLYSMPSRGLGDIGTSMGFLLPGTIGDIEVGAYYERNRYLGKNENSENSDTSNSFTTSANYTGIYTTLYLLGTKNLVAGINARAGMVDTDKVVITFAAIAEYYVKENLALGVSARFISQLPVVEMKASLNLAGVAGRIKRQEKYAETKVFYQNLRKDRH